MLLQRWLDNFLDQQSFRPKMYFGRPPPDLWKCSCFKIAAYEFIRLIDIDRISRVLQFALDLTEHDMFKLKREGVRAWWTCFFTQQIGAGQQQRVGCCQRPLIFDFLASQPHIQLPMALSSHVTSHQLKQEWLHDIISYDIVARGNSARTGPVFGLNKGHDIFVSKYVQILQATCRSIVSFLQETFGLSRPWQHVGAIATRALEMEAYQSSATWMRSESWVVREEIFEHEV